MERVELIARLRHFAGPALVERGGACFLIDPQWGERERGQWEALAARTPAGWSDTPEAERRGWLCIPTGGSSGAMKLARHDEHTIGAAVAGFVAHFGVARVNAIGLLPPWHVSGLMAWARCVWTGGEYRAVSWKEVESGENRPVFLPGSGRFISLVPTQLARLLPDPAAVDWLRTFTRVLLGGGPAWPALLAQARAKDLPLILSYGMTETAAMVCAQTPADFASGDASSGQALPHTSLRVEPDGRLALAGPSLFRGYWPNDRSTENRFWQTDDLGELDAEGRLFVRGRADALIISGGEKINPAEVESMLRELDQAHFADVIVLGLPHDRWGQEVVAFYPRIEGREALAPEELSAKLRAHLAPAKQPKRYIAVPAAAWPRDARGKVNRAALALWATPPAE